jgi:hypothetical protein
MNVVPIRHDGPCGQRSVCWRPACRAAYPDALTVEWFPSRRIIARCHEREYTACDLDHLADLARHGRAAA